jgi:hypothetical protein
MQTDQPSSGGQENVGGVKNDNKPGVDMCQYTLVKSKRKGQQCHRKATKNWDGHQYCLYHYRMISTKELPAPTRSEPTEKIEAVTQLQFPVESTDGGDDMIKPTKKRKRPIYNDDPSSDSSDDEMDFGNVWNGNTIDFNALERMCLDAFHKSSNVYK